MPKIYVVSTHTHKPTGGIVMLHRLVETLNQLGYDSSILYVYSDCMYKRMAWFEYNTPVEYIQSVNINRKDILVLPEIIGAGHFARFTYNTKVIYNQNSGHAIPNIAIWNKQNNVKSVIHVSIDNMTRTIDSLSEPVPCDVLYNYIDDATFYPKSEKKLQVAYMARKDGDIAANIISEKFPELPLVRIDGIPQSEVADILRESALFLFHTNQMEGWPLPIAEAMACGCVVIGMASGGSTEQLDPNYSYVYTDISKLVDTVERVLQENDLTSLEYKGKLASTHVLTNYTKENFTKNVDRIFREIV